MQAIGQEFFGASGTTAAFQLGATGNGIPAGAERAVVQAQAQPLRYWLNGVDPTTTAGFLLPVNSTIEITGDQLRGFRGINSTAGTIVAVQYYGSGA